MQGTAVALSRKTTTNALIKCLQNLFVVQLNTMVIRIGCYVGYIN